MQTIRQTIEVQLAPEQAALLEQVVVDAILYAEDHQLDPLWMLYRQIVSARWDGKVRRLRLRQLPQPPWAMQKVRHV